MIHVGQHLVVGIGVDRGHNAVFHTYVFVQYLDHRGQAVGRTGGVGDDRIRFFQNVVVDAVNDGRIDILAAGCGNNDFFCPSPQVGACFFLAGEETGGFMDHVHAQFVPGQLCRVPFRQHPYPVVVDQHIIAVYRYRSGKLAVGGIVAGQVGVGIRISQVVDRNDADLVGTAALVQRP